LVSAPGRETPGQPELLGDLTEQDWAVLLPTLELIKDHSLEQRSAAG
jgi:hypothetical protein